MPNNPLPACTGDEPYVFVCYSHRDQDMVYPEIRWLQDQGFNVWYDEGISGATRWRDEIAGRIKQCRMLLFYVSPDSVDSQVCREELEYALTHDCSILSLHLSATDLPEGIKLAIANRQALHRYELSEQDYERKLVAALSRQLDQEVPVTTTPLRTRQRMRPQKIISAIAGLLATVAITAGAVWWLMRPTAPDPAPAARFELELPNMLFSQGGSKYLAIDPAGTNIFIIGTSGFKDEQIYTRKLDEFEFKPIPGTQDGELLGVFPSPNGQTLALAYRDGSLKRVSASGGDPVLIGKTSNNGFSFHIGWIDDTTILVQDRNALVRWSINSALPPTTLVEQGAMHPHVLPDGSTFVFAERGAAGSPSRIVIQSLITGERKSLLEGSDPRLTERGHLLFYRDDAVWAVRFDSHELAILGSPVRVLSEVSAGGGKAKYDVASTGTMVYHPPSRQLQQLIWETRDGLQKTIPMSPTRISAISLSPDESQITYAGGTLFAGELWTYEFDRGIQTRILEVAGSANIPLWSSDDTSIIYSLWTNKINGNLYRKELGRSDPERLTESARTHIAVSSTADGSHVLYIDCIDAGVDCDIGILPISNPKETRLILNSRFNELSPQLSPDGEYLAYSSDEFGPRRIVIRPFPDVEANVWQTSVSGCIRSEWSDNQNELFLFCLDGTYVVPVANDPQLTLGEPERLFEKDPLISDGNYSSSRDEFIRVKQINSNNRFVVVLNWFDELDRLTVSGD